MKLEIWDWQVNNLIFEIPEDNIMKFKDNGDMISGVGFWSTECRQIQVKYHMSDGTNQYLDQYFFQLSSYVGNSNYLKCCVVCEYNGEEEYYFIDSNTIDKDYKNNTISFKADNLLGLMIDFMDTEVEFQNTILYSSEGVIETLISKIFEAIENNEYNYNLNIDYDNAGIDVTNFNIKYIHRELFSGTDPFIDISDDHEKSLSWQFIGERGNNTQLVIINLDWQDWQDQEGTWHNTIDIKHIKLEFDEDINYTVKEFVNTEEHDSGSYSHTLWWTYCNYFSSLYGYNGFACNNTISSQTQYTNPTGYDYELDLANLYFTGAVVNDNIKFKQEEGEEVIDFDIKKGLRLMLLYNNLYIRTNKNNIYVGARFSSGLSAINITEDHLIEKSKSMIGKEELPENIFEIVDSNYAEYLVSFYETFFETIRKNMELEILNEYDLSILDKISIQGGLSNLIIHKIKKDIDNQLYTVEAWR